MSEEKTLVEANRDRAADGILRAYLVRIGLLETELAKECDRIAHLEQENARLVNALEKIQDFVNEQAEDEGLWSVPAVGTQPIAEAYLQQELRKLHAVIEQALEGSGGK